MAITTDVDYSKSTDAYPLGSTVPTVIEDPEVDYSKSTMAYPMEKAPTPVVVESDIDYSKSTGAYPMYGDANDPRIQVALREKVDPAFATPGPVSSGRPASVTAQREALGLTADPTGESDTDYEARPSSTPVLGADGVDREHVYQGGYLTSVGGEPVDEATGRVVATEPAEDQVVEGEGAVDDGVEKVDEGDGVEKEAVVASEPGPETKAVDESNVETKVVAPEKAPKDGKVTTK